MSPPPGRPATLGWVLLLASGWLAGCGSVPPIHYYLLADPGAGEIVVDATSPRAGQALRLAELGVAPPYGQDRLVYRIDDGQAESAHRVGFYQQHRWAAPPASLITEALLGGLRQTPGLAAVEPGDWRPGNLALGGRVLWLEELDRGATVTARIALDLSLYGPDGERLWQRRFSADRVGQAVETQQVVGLLRQALAEVVEQVASAVASTTADGSSAH